MAQNPLIRRYLDAGMAFTQMTRERAEEIVRAQLGRTRECEHDVRARACGDCETRGRCQRNA